MTDLKLHLLNMSFGLRFLRSKKQDHCAKEKICFVGFYLADSDKLIAMQTNEYFHEHTEEYVMPDRYASGVYNTDNFYEYYVDLSEYANQDIYIRIVDNDESYYYG